MTSSPRASRASLLVVMSFAGSTFVVPVIAGASPFPTISGAHGATARPPLGVPGPGAPGATQGRRKKSTPRISAKVSTQSDKASTKASTRASTTTASRARTTTSRPRRRRSGGQRALAGARAGAVPIAKLGALPPLVPSPGPSSTPEALRAQDQAARGQIERAASAARRPALTDRWQTVAFLLSGVDGTRYPEATFWRALAAYRRGDLDGGDKIRLRSSPLASPDAAVLDGERSTALQLAARSQGQGASSRDGDEGIAGAARRGAPGFQSAAYVQGAAARSTGVSNETPYTGPAPSATAPSSVAAN